MRGNKTPLAPGMCFSDEPMIAIYGEFGIRLEDCLYMTDKGPKFFTRAVAAIDKPFCLALSSALSFQLSARAFRT